MKAHKNLNRIILLIVSISANAYLNLTAQITGPTYIVPGEATQYYWSRFGYTDPAWSASFSTFSPNANSGSPYITVGKNITSPSLQIKVVAKDVSTPTLTITDYKTVDVNPFITGPTNIQPGQSITLSNQDNREGYAGHNACYWNWSASDSGPLTCSGSCNTSTSGSVVFSCPTTLPSAVLSSGYYTISCTKFCGLGSYSYPSNARVNVSFATPVINGPSEISCNASLSNLVYSVTNLPQASYYEWQVPSGWAISGNSHSSSISVANFGNPGGYIKVTAYAYQNSALKSAQAIFDVGCCPTTVIVTDPVLSGNTDRRQANHSIVASNVVNGGATAKYHGGSYVYLTAGFGAMPESNVHFYPEICTSTYQRKALQNEANAGQEDMLSEENTFATDPFFLNIFPNPTNNRFKISLDKSKDLPVSISLKDLLGKELRVITNPESYECEFDLSDFSRGVYLLNINYPEKTIAKKIIRN